MFPGIDAIYKFSQLHNTYPCILVIPTKLKLGSTLPSVTVQTVLWKSKSSHQPSILLNPNLQWVWSCLCIIMLLVANPFKQTSYCVQLFIDFSTRPKQQFKLCFAIQVWLRVWNAMIAFAFRHSFFLLIIASEMILFFQEQITSLLAFSGAYLPMTRWIIWIMLRCNA